MEFDIRVYTDGRNEKIGSKIRDAELKKVPIMLIVGQKEMDSQSVSIRRRHQGDLGSESLDILIRKLVEEIKKRRRY